MSRMDALVALAWYAACFLAPVAIYALAVSLGRLCQRVRHPRRRVYDWSRERAA